MRYALDRILSPFAKRGLVRSGRTATLLNHSNTIVRDYSLSFEPSLKSTLPHDREKNFYDRVPPSRRPRFLRPVSDAEEKGKAADRNPATEKEDIDTRSSSQDGTLPVPVTSASTPEKTAEEKKAEAKLKKKYPGGPDGGTVLVDGKVYDQSLVIALSNTFFWQFWSCGSPRSRRVVCHLLN